MDMISCPNADRLRDFAVGDLRSAEFERIAGHVENCSSCLATLESLDDDGDDLLAQLRETASSGPTKPDPVPGDLITKARFALGSRGSSSIEATMDPGRRLATALDDGPCRLGKFELQQVLGVGTFGYVFRARDTELDRTVAIKVYRSSVLDNKEEHDRASREARSAAQLKHPSILSLYETGQSSDGAHYLVTEFIEGETLEHRLSRSAFEPADGAGWIADVAEALHYAHSMGVIHRDIKPANLMLDPDGKPHIMDFGMAKREAGEVTVTREGDIMGTPAYTSPEQAMGEAHFVDARSDIFSLGAVLYEILTGDRPFQGNRRMILLQVMEEEPRAPRLLNDRIPRDLETICLKAMSKAPNRRYQTARAMALDLRKFLAGEPIHARPVGWIERGWRWCVRNPVPTGITLAVFLGMSGGVLHLSQLSGDLLQQNALESAQMHAEMLDQMNKLYSAEVADPMRNAGISVTHNFEGDEHAIPLPATFTIALGENMRGCSYGMQVRLYSDFPFATRVNGGPRDAFERYALDALTENSQEPVYRFEEIDGRHSLRFATARVMQESCVDCHNNHPASTKRDWKVGQVRGVLEIIHPLENDVRRVREGLRGTFTLIGVISGFFLSMAVGVAFLANWRRRKRFAATE